MPTLLFSSHSWQSKVQLAASKYFTDDLLLQVIHMCGYKLSANKEAREKE